MISEEQRSELLRFIQLRAPELSNNELVLLCRAVAGCISAEEVDAVWAVLTRSAMGGQGSLTANALVRHRTPGQPSKVGKVHQLYKERRGRGEPLADTIRLEVDAVFNEWPENTPRPGRETAAKAIAERLREDREKLRK